MDLARIDGVELDFLVSGIGEPAVFIHGAFIADTFRPLLDQPELAGKFQFILYHRRGHAGSSHTSGISNVAEQARDLQGLLGYLGVERAHVVGHSYGGCVALQLALEAPSIVHSLALLEPGLMIGKSGDGYRESLVRGRERFEEVGATIAVNEFLQARWPSSAADLERVLPGALGQAVADAATWFECDLPGQLAWKFGETEALRIIQPTLSVLGGESEALWSRFGETHRLILEWFPEAEGIIVPGTTHLMQLQDPRVTAEALAAFWARHPFQPGHA